MSKREVTYKHGRTVAGLRASGRRVKLLRNVRDERGSLLVGAGTLGHAEFVEGGKAYVAFDGQGVVREVVADLLTLVEGKGRAETQKAARGRV